MQLYAYKRFRYTAQFHLPLADPNSDTPVLTFIKDVHVDFTNDPNSPKQVIVCEEPLPSAGVLTAMTDPYGNELIPGGEWTITTIEPVFNPLGFRELFKMQVNMRTKPDFGYEGIVRA